MSWLSPRRDDHRYTYNTSNSERSNAKMKKAKSEGRLFPPSSELMWVVASAYPKCPLQAPIGTIRLAIQFTGKNHLSQRILSKYKKEKTSNNTLERKNSYTVEYATSNKSITIPKKEQSIDFRYIFVNKYVKFKDIIKQFSNGIGVCRDLENPDQVFNNEDICLNHICSGHRIGIC